MERHIIHNVQLLLVVLPSLLVGCSTTSRTNPRASSSALPSEPATASSHDTIVADATPANVQLPHSARNTGPTSRPDQLFGYTIGPTPNYDISLEDIRKHVLNQTAVIVDARGTADFGRGHVRGAINMPAGRKEAYLGQLTPIAAPDQLIIIYCNGPHCDSGDMVYEYLASQGFTNMRVFKPGWDALSKESDIR